MALLLGIDIGTSSVKAVVFDTETSKILVVAADEYPIYKPTPERAEQNPDDWWQATVNVVHQLPHRSEIAAVGFSGQMHGVAFLDRAGNVFHPAIIWADQRSAEQCSQMIAKLG